ncbi:fruit body lectin, partial [Geopyxis carbonaria]
AYTINLSFKVEDPAEKLTILEKSCWHDAGCIWSTWEDCHVLEMDDSGTSGMLRLMTADGVRFAVIVGVHRHKPWCDILVDLKRDDTLMKLHQTYYGSGWRTAEWQQLSSVTKETIAGKTLNINFYGTDGRQLHAYLNY